MSDRKKKKKKKGTGGGRKPTYAKGKKVEPSKKKRPVAKKPTSAGREAVKKSQPSKGKEPEGPRPGAFNLIRKGTIEMKVFMALLVVLVVAVASGFPLALERSEYDEEHPGENSSRALLIAEDIGSSTDSVVKAQEEKDEPGEEKEQKDEGEGKDEEEKEELSTMGAFFFFVIQFLFFWIIFLFLGLNISRKVGLKTPILDKWARGEQYLPDMVDALKVVVPLGIISAAIAFGFQALFNVFGNIEAEGFKPSFWSQVLASFGSGAMNEILLRLFLMSALVWLFMRWSDKGVWAAIIVSSFALAIPNFFYSDVQKVVAARELVTITTLGLFAGVLYYKRGFEHALIIGTISAVVFTCFSYLIL